MRSRDLCHQNHPFLDPEYSPSGRYPFTDFTYEFAEWLRNGNIDAIEELWKYIAGTDHVERICLSKGLSADMPQEFGFDDETAYEAKAIHLLGTRQALCGTNPESATFVSSELFASRLACMEWMPAPEIHDRLWEGARVEANVEGGRGMKARKKEKADQAMQTLLNPITEPLSNAGQWLLRIPPMSRLVVADYFTRSWGSGKLRPDLYYPERCYGCCAAWNLHYIDYVNCFDWPGDDYLAPTGLTKKHMQEALRTRGVKISSSMKKDELFKICQQHEGVVSGLFRAHVPDLRKPKPEWDSPLRAWARRIKDIECVASAILKTLATQGLQGR